MLPACTQALSLAPPAGRSAARLAFLRIQRALLQVRLFVFGVRLSACGLLASH
jgi:hypothetical protein